MAQPHIKYFQYSKFQNYLNSQVTFQDMKAIMLWNTCLIRGNGSFLGIFFFSFKIASLSQKIKRSYSHARGKEREDFCEGPRRWIVILPEWGRGNRKHFLQIPFLRMNCILIISKCLCRLPVGVKNILPRNIIRKD